LEKIEMKKTLVAVAAMAAVTGAMAEVTLSGQIDQTYSSTKLNSAVKITDVAGSGAGSNTLGDTFVTFSGSEDLGGGMKASFKVEPRLDPNAAAHTMTNREAWVGVSGGFGSINVGNNYAPSFLLFAAATDPNGVSNGAGHLGWASGTATIYSGASSINYMLPSLVPGLSIGIAKVQGGANAQSATLAGAGDAQSYALAYTTGALTVGLASQSTKNTALGYDTPTQGLTGTAGVNDTTVEAAAIGSSLKTTNTGIIYKAGFATVSYLGTKSSLKSDSISTTTYGVSVPFGATTVGYSTGTAKAVNAASEYKMKSSQMVISYALSKRTKAYFQSGSISASTGTADKVSQQGFGINHGF
jgi:predicted porin